MPLFSFQNFLTSFLVEIIVFLHIVAAPSWSPLRVPHYLLLASGRANIQNKVFLIFTAVLLSLHHTGAKGVYTIFGEKGAQDISWSIEGKNNKISIHILLFNVSPFLKNFIYKVHNILANNKYV